jgi:hypothetical protein
MAINKEAHQVEIANQLVDAARALAHSTRSIPNPSDSYELLGALGAVQETLTQIYAQLAVWHRSAVDGTHYSGTDGRSTSEIPATEETAALLESATASASRAANRVDAALGANGVIRWFDEVKKEEEARP